MLFIVTMISVNMLSAEKICWKLVILILSLLANVVQLSLVAAELLLEFLFDIYFSCYRKIWSNFEICWPITVHYMHCFRILYSMIICWSIKF